MMGSWCSCLKKIGLTRKVHLACSKSSRGFVNFPKSTRSGLEEVCVSDNRRFAAVSCSCCCESLVTSTGSLFSFFFFFSFWLCASLVSRLAPDIMLLQRLGVIGINLILIYSLYRKKYRWAIKYFDLEFHIFTLYITP
jgi:hypothetical protein